MRSLLASLDLICLAAIRQARATFFDAVERLAADAIGVDGPSDLDREHRKLLRSDGLYQIAEFFYVLRYGGLSIPDDLGGFLERHNADMKRLLETCRGGYTEGGLSAQRLKRAMFSPGQINYVLHESAQGDARFDQQSLQRIFTQAMSFETCRNMLVILSEYGFLRRWEFNQVIIGSTNVLEPLFKTHLETIATGILSHET